MQSLARAAWRSSRFISNEESGKKFRLDKEIEDKVESCDDYQNLDTCLLGNGPGLVFMLTMLEGCMFLLLADVHSKWLEVVPDTSATSADIIDQLCLILSTDGLPEMLVSNKWVRSTQFKSLMVFVMWHLHRITLWSCWTSCANIQRKHEEIYRRFTWHKTLITYRTTPHATTGISPAEKPRKTEVGSWQASRKFQVHHEL